MPLQTAVNLYQAEAVAGDRASLNEIIYHTSNPLAVVDITVGTFVWIDGAEGLVNYGGSGKPLGFVERWLAYSSWHDSNSINGTLVINKESQLQVARQGDFWAICKTAAVIGQKIFASTIDGTISAADAGDTVADSVETDWMVKTDGDAGDLIIISSWN